ncbi:MAG TPA: TspO/MBR family protein [Candidatus Limnocylindria bacterium]|nr:TspO/MBR family protein [Candidatus Limnocylindria bacterium]
MTAPKATTCQSLALVQWLALCFAASATVFIISPAGWYAGLQKPSWNPPGWIFGPVWTLLYLSMAVSAWLVWREGGWNKQRWALGLFLAQWLLNTLWTPLFFGMHLSGVALAEIIGLWMVLVATLVAFWKVKISAAILLMPYVLWVCFAVALNYTIWKMNS